MSDLISRKTALERAEACTFTDKNEKRKFMDWLNYCLDAAIEPQWIPCSERMPEEHDSIFKKKFKGTDRWNNGMFEGISDDVNVTVECKDGKRKTMTSHTLDGKWKCETEYKFSHFKVIAWMPLPQPYKGE